MRNKRAQIYCVDESKEERKEELSRAKRRDRLGLGRTKERQLGMQLNN
jgi:hypothetical protein